MIILSYDGGGDSSISSLEFSIEKVEIKEKSFNYDKKKFDQSKSFVPGKRMAM